VYSVCPDKTDDRVDLPTADNKDNPDDNAAGKPVFQTTAGRKPDTSGTTHYHKYNLPKPDNRSKTPERNTHCNDSGTATLPHNRKACAALANTVRAVQSNDIPHFWTFRFATACNCLSDKPLVWWNNPVPPKPKGIKQLVSSYHF
jgi:hypothetical protein